MSKPKTSEVARIDHFGCCYNAEGEHAGSFEPMPLSNDEIVSLFQKYEVEKQPTFTERAADGTEYTKTVVLFRDKAGWLQESGIELTEISNSSSEHFELKTEINGLIFC